MRKNTLKIFSRLAIVLGFAAIFASCSNLTEANVVEKNAKTRTLSIAVSNYDELVKSSKEMAKLDNARKALSNSNSTISRTIISDSFTLDSASGTLYLFGTDANGNKFLPKGVTFTGKDPETEGGEKSKTVGTIAIPTDQGTFNWDFTLALVQSNDVANLTLQGTSDKYNDDVKAIKDVAVLIGYSSMDMSNGDKATFTLSPDGLTAQASIAMKVYLDNWEIPDGYNSTTIGIYKLTDGSVINDATETPASTERTYNGGTDPDNAKLQGTNPGAANYNVTSIAPGTYSFKVTFENTTDKKKYTWNDVIIVLPGKTTNNTIAIPNVIGDKPVVPTSFDAKYIVDSEDKTNGYYTTEFTWVRNETKKNENFFEIDVLKIADTETQPVTIPTSDNDWADLFDATDADKVTYGENLLSSDEYVSGSLLSGNSTAQLRLELGLRYFARIRAVNDAGESDWKYVAFDGTSDDTTKKAFTSTTINRYRISYFLNGGTLTKDGKTYSESNKIDTYVAYFCQNETGTAILKPNGTDTKLEMKVISSTGTEHDLPWTEWKIDDGTKYDIDTKPNYTGYKNYNFYAYYDSNSDVELYDHSSYRIKDTWIKVAVGDAEAMDITKSTNDGQDSGTVTINAKDVTGNAIEKATWMFKPVDDSEKITNDFKFDSVSFVVSKGGQYKEVASAKDVGTAGTQFDMNLKPLTNGVYNVTFTAITGITTVQYQVTVNITR